MLSRQPLLCIICDGVLTILGDSSGEEGDYVYASREALGGEWEVCDGGRCVMVEVCDGGRCVMVEVCDGGRCVMVGGM